jgi:hypothetical protein
MASILLRLPDGFLPLKGFTIVPPKVLTIVPQSWRISSTPRQSLGAVTTPAGGD